ncbi:MAG: hypothetical protein R3257_02295, partial [bacterium]|nr:hypothetical protein [bacterium]
EDSFTKRPQFVELRRMESSQGKEEEKDKSITGLRVSGDDHLNKEYKDVDAALDKMAAQTKDSIRETLGLKPGQKIPGPMYVQIGVNSRPGAPQTLRLQSVKAKAGFRYRIHGSIPMYRTSSDLSVAAQDAVPSTMFPAYVDLSQITNGQRQIVLKINSDGSHELVLPEGKDPIPFS